MQHFHDILAYELFAVGDTPINVATMALALIVCLLALILAKVIERALARFLRRQGVEDEGSIGATTRLAYYVVLVVGFAVAVHTLGINLTALFTAGAVFAIAFGFAMQNITQNFVSGLILLVERTIKPGDVVEVEGHMVRVTELGMRATVTRTLDAEDYIIPNSVLVSSTVKNFTLRDRLYRLRCAVGVSYDSDMRKVEEVLLGVARGLEWRSDAVEPVVLLKEFGSSSVDWDVSVWVDDPFARSITRSDLNKAVWFGLLEAGITIAYPQLDLHLDAASRAAIQGRPSPE